MASIAATFAHELSVALKGADAPANPLTDDVGAWVERFRIALDDVGDAEDDSGPPVKLPAGWLVQSTPPRVRDVGTKFMLRMEIRPDYQIAR